MQLFIRVNALGEDAYEMIRRKLIDVDDFVQARGTMMRTRTGEVSVNVDEIRLISKALTPLPVVKQQRLADGSIIEYGEFKDTESRYRQRYADLAVNKSVRDIFVKRAGAIKRCAIFSMAKACWKWRRRSCSRFMAGRRRVPSPRITINCIRISSADQL